MSMRAESALENTNTARINRRYSFGCGSNQEADNRRQKRTSQPSNGLQAIITFEALINEAKEKLNQINTEITALTARYKRATPYNKEIIFNEFKVIFEKLINYFHEYSALYVPVEEGQIGHPTTTSTANINFPNIDNDLRALYVLLQILTPNHKDFVLAQANNLVLNPSQTDPVLSRHIGKMVIRNIHQRIPLAMEKKLLNNLRSGMHLFSGVPFSYGGNGRYVMSNGHLNSQTGIDCIGYINILTNLACGIHDYSYNVGGMTGANMFRKKPEFARSGIRPTPIIDQLPMRPYEPENIEKLLDQYGCIFTVQIYLKNHDPYHVILIYKEDGVYKVTESDIGNQVVCGRSFADWYRSHRNEFGYLTFNVINPNNVGEFAEGKPPEFMHNLTNDLTRIKRNSIEFEPITITP